MHTTNENNKLFLVQNFKTVRLCYGDRVFKMFVNYSFKLIIHKRFLARIG